MTEFGTIAPAASPDTIPPVSGLVVLVTGASSGIGQRLAETMSARGHRVFAGSRRPGNGSSARVLPLDVRDDGSVAAAVGTVLSEAGRIDVLVNCAGYLHEGPLEELTLDELKAVFDTNFFGTARMVAAVLPGMRARRRGHLVNVSALAGLLAMPFWGAYCASKAALEAYSEALRQEVKPLGIRVSLVEPSFFRTALAGRKRRTAGTIPDYDPHRQRMLAALEEEERRAPEPREVVDLMVRIVEKPSTRLRHLVGRGGKNYVLRRMMSEPMWDAAFRRHWRLDGQRRPGTGTGS